MTKKKKEAVNPFQLYYEQKWCPLFGPLPEIEYYSNVQSKAIDIIWRVRYMWGVNEWGGIPYGLSSKNYTSRPEPQRIPGYPALLLTTIRAIFDSHGHTRQVTLMSHYDSLEYKVTEAIDCVRSTLWGDDFDDDIPDYAIIATFALAEAWDVLESVLEDGMSEDSPDILKTLLTATSLLMIAKEKKLEPDFQKQMKIREANMRFQDERRQNKQAIYDIWQMEANGIWNNNARLSKSAVARLIVKKFGRKYETKQLVASEQTIRKKIKKPTF